MYILTTRMGAGSCVLDTFDVLPEDLDALILKVSGAVGANHAIEDSDTGQRWLLRGNERWKEEVRYHDQGED